ncbi:hypothetical protein BH23PAT2_BH23PAT2_05350 [soil metagenome]
MAKTKISDDEKKILIAYVKTPPLLLIRLKSQAVLLASKAMTDEDIADVLGRKQRTVTLWRRDWNRRHSASLFTGHKNNQNSAKLTKQQKEQIKQTGLIPNKVGYSSLSL